MPRPCSTSAAAAGWWAGASLRRSTSTSSRSYGITAHGWEGGGQSMPCAVQECHAQRMGAMDAESIEGCPPPFPYLWMLPKQLLDARPLEGLWSPG
eukprot:909831-Pelagomonas_calceolata.AAC.1